MTYLESKLDEIHKIIKDIYGDMTRVDIGVTAEGLEVTAQNRHNVCGYSMKRIDGTWVNKVDK